VKTVAQVLQVPSETEDPQEPWEYQAPRDLMVIQERQVNKALQECQVKEVPLGKMGRLALLAPLARLVSQVTEENRDLRV